MDNLQPIPASSGSNGSWQSIKEWFQVIVVALVVALPIRYFIAEPFIVQGASMDPTFSTGQFLIVDLLSYRFGEPKRGDVVIFEYPNNPNLYYIKRIVGLPGETIRLRNGHPYASTDTTCNNVTSSTETEITEPYIQSSHISKDNACNELSEGQYFVMGDNRAESSDSRAWGPLDKKFIVGKPVVRLLPLSAIDVLPGEYRQ